LIVDFSAKVDREEFLSQEFGMQVYTELVMIMELE
jgi:hypothetical protein